MSEPAAFSHEGESVNLLSEPECVCLGICQEFLLCHFGFVKPVSSLRICPFLFRSLWKLDLCTIVLPQIEKLLQSKYER